MISRWFFIIEQRAVYKINLELKDESEAIASDFS